MNWCLIGQCGHDGCWKERFETDMEEATVSPMDTLRSRQAAQEFVELDDEGGYARTTDGQWHLTPLGLAQWMDQEGGLAGLMQRNGAETFIEAGCGQAVVHAYIAATEAMERELERIGAVL